MITYVLPTKDRPQSLARTLHGISALGPHDAEVIVADNASATPVRWGAALDSGVPVKVVRMPRNIGAAARNAAAAEASEASEWIVMLDDDSRPMDLGHLAALKSAGQDVAAVAAEIFLPGPGGHGVGRRESGGLPEVFIGCGVAIRTEVYRALGGYDPKFDYYAEEYDLAARLMMQGWRVVMDRRFRVLHEKVSGGRDMARILQRLVRNNAWIAKRYAPDGQVWGEVRRQVTRYREIAAKEGVSGGWFKGVLELLVTLLAQPRRTLDEELWNRFTGLAAARAALRAAHGAKPLGKVCVFAPGKNEHLIVQALGELGVETLSDPTRADTLVPGTLSPGPMLDAADDAAGRWAGKRVVLPFHVASEAGRRAVA